VRYRDFAAEGDPFVDAGRSVVLVDAMLWPAYLKVRRGPPENALSLDLSAYFHATPGEVQWLFVEATAEMVGGGTVAGAVKVWTPAGILVASGATQMLHWPA
jgi:acyl-CoA thioesterase